MDDISITTNIAAISRTLSALAYKQLPFATAKALTSLAKLVREEEVKNLEATFKNPSPFTLRSVRSTVARKDSLEATVFVMDKTAAYLRPYEAGGVHKLSGRALLNPKDIALNQYGQLSRGTLAKLKGRSDVFIGPVRTAKGVVNGVWQRPSQAQKGRASKRGGIKRNESDKLILLIRFGDAIPVKKQLGYQARATKVINSSFNAHFGRAMAQAIATSQR